MLQRMIAECLFLDPNDLSPGSAALVERGFDVEVLDWIDDCGPTVWVKARITSELDEYRFLDWVKTIIEPFSSGDVVEAGLERSDAAVNIG